MAMLVGVISDTHGLLRPQVFDLFAHVDCIIHAGDIGNERILGELEVLAPVHAVYGNTDGFPLVNRLPEKQLLQLEEFTLFVTHIGGEPKALRSRHPEVEESDLVIFGHSHQTLQLKDQGVLFFNPGAAGPRRFSLPATVGRIRIENQSISTEFIEIG